MLSRLLSFLFILCLISSSVHAQGIVTLSNDIDEVSDKTVAPKQLERPILNEIKTAIGDFASKNITDNEQVFCYQIATPPANYTGYTIDGMAVVSFCGIIDEKLRGIIKNELLSKPENIIFDKTEECVIRPQIMLRFIRGVDFTDILLSAPCHAVAVFYGGKVSAFNAKPAGTVIDNLVRALLKNKVDFISPALFNQLLPIGTIKNEEQKSLQEKKNAPFMQWKQNQQEKATKSAGWNKLKSQQ